MTPAQHIIVNPVLFKMQSYNLCISKYFILSDIETKNNNLVAKYHPNFWMDGKWRCCQQTEKLAAGCHVYDPEGYGMYYFLASCFNAYFHLSIWYSITLSYTDVYEQQ